MESIFLSYTYNPHTDSIELTRRLERNVRVVIESMGLRIDDGLDLGGRAIDSEIERRINEADALVAVITPWDDGSGHPTTPPYVQDEYRHAASMEKPAIRIIDRSLAARGMGQQREYIVHERENEADALLKLMRTIAVWKNQVGRAVQIELEPPELGERFEEGAFGHQCEYQLLVRFQKTPWERAQIWHEPGATFAHLPRVPDEAKIRLRLQLANERWESAFSHPLGRITMERRIS